MKVGLDGTVDMSCYYEGCELNGGHRGYHVVAGTFYDDRGRAQAHDLGETECDAEGCSMHHPKWRFEIGDKVRYFPRGRDVAITMGRLNDGRYVEGGWTVTGHQSLLYVIERRSGYRETANERDIALEICRECPRPLPWPWPEDLCTTCGLARDHGAHVEPVIGCQPCNEALLQAGKCPACVHIGDGFGPSHNGSRRCESGSIASGGNRAHCSCDTCF